MRWPTARLLPPTAITRDGVLFFLLSDTTTGSEISARTEDQQPTPTSPLVERPTFAASLSDLLLNNIAPSGGRGLYRRGDEVLRYDTSDLHASIQAILPFFEHVCWWRHLDYGHWLATSAPNAPTHPLTHRIHIWRSHDRSLSI